MNATITNSVTLADHEIIFYPQQNPRIRKLKSKIRSAEVKSLETLHLISKDKGKNNQTDQRVLLEQTCPDIRVFLAK